MKTYYGLLLLNLILNNYDKYYIKIRFGNVIAPSFERITNRLVEDIESALINYHELDYNITSTDTYWGRDIPKEIMMIKRGSNYIARTII